MKNFLRNVGTTATGVSLGLILFLLICFLGLSILCLTIASKITGNQTAPKPAQNTSSSNSSSNALIDSGFTQLSFIPYNYTLKDIGNGMNLGTLFLAIENTSDQVFYSNQNQGYLINGLVLTNEGAEYETKNTTTIDYTHAGRIPPGFRFYDFAIQWESAKAATPKKILLTFPQLGDHVVELELPPQNTTLNFPFDTPPSQIKTISSLKDVVLEDNPEGLKLSLTGECTINRDGFRSLQAILFNQDNFHPHNEEELENKAWEMSLFHSTRPDSGNFIMNVDQVGKLGWTRISDDIGPGQSAPINIKLGGRSPAILVWWDNDKYSIFDLSNCE